MATLIWVCAALAIPPEPDRQWDNARERAGYQPESLYPKPGVGDRLHGRYYDESGNVYNRQNTLLALQQNECVDLDRYKRLKRHNTAWNVLAAISAGIWSAGASSEQLYSLMVVGGAVGTPALVGLPLSRARMDAEVRRQAERFNTCDAEQEAYP